MTQSEKKVKTLREIGLSKERAEAILTDEKDSFWEGVASGSISLTPNQLETLFTNEEAA